MQLIELLCQKKGCQRDDISIIGYIGCGLDLWGWNRPNSAFFDRHV